MTIFTAEHRALAENLGTKCSSEPAESTDSAPEAGAPETEITPEMVEAGLEELWAHPITEPTEAEMRIAVTCVVRAALSSRPRSPHR
jgi:hypothetical protein